MKREFGVIHCIAECEDCDWRNENYKNAQATAAIHARAHKHKVSVEVCVSGFYDGRSTQDE
ncbi:MAG: hypothetical protein ACYS21_20905 [Planctomycetota bacterium]